MMLIGVGGRIHFFGDIFKYLSVLPYLKQNIVLSNNPQKKSFSIKIELGGAVLLTEGQQFPYFLVFDINRQFLRLK